MYPSVNHHHESGKRDKDSEVITSASQPLDNDLRALAIHPITSEVTSVDNFKVFLKRHLKNQPPPAGLLESIHARIDELKKAQKSTENE